MVRLALERYSADRIGKYDFALENSGGRVILDKCSPTFPPTVLLFGIIPVSHLNWYGSRSLKLIIQVSRYSTRVWSHA